MDIFKWFEKNVDGEAVLNTALGVAAVGAVVWGAKKFGPKPVKKVARVVQGGGK